MESSTRNEPGTCHEHHFIERGAPLGRVRGLSGILWVRWFASRNLSLMGEYGCDAVHFYQVTKAELRRQASSSQPGAPPIMQIDKHSQKVTQKGVRVSPSSLRFGLSLRFR